MTDDDATQAEAPPGPPAPSRAALLEVHRDMLERWRSVLNLIGPGPSAVHYQDAEAALADLHAPEGRWADLGTGAGFPGVVLATHFPTLQVELVDSRQKRCNFLEEVVERSGVTGVTVRCTRIEDLPDRSYDGITARALAPPAEVCEIALRLLRINGLALLLVGEAAEFDVPDGLALLADRSYRVAGLAHRAVLLQRVARL
jgi:16S rRNA (guanine527-N7)-methyltransferase